MTVDENSFTAFLETNPDKGKDFVVRLRDVTGISDDAELYRALDKSRESSGGFNLNRAIELLLEWSGSDRGERIVEGEEKMPPSPAVVMNTVSAQRPVVDLTEDKDDLRRAIALSLADGSPVSTGTSSRPAGVSQEDQDVSKALEASLLESVSSQRTTDGQNPNDRKRESDWPVGLKNVGQTCWFSAVIQSFFHLPAFRRLVLNCKPPEREPKSDKERKILDFMLELRKLFSLLLGSHRKYVDPSRAVGILRGNLGGDNNFCNNQQDVSEFTHKLLDWLEEAFKTSEKCETALQLDNTKGSEAMDAESEKCDKEKDFNKEDAPPNTETPNQATASEERKNPMFDFFYGKVRIEGKNQGNEFSREEQFGQWPLQVNNFSHIHDSLEASTAHEFIDMPSTSDLQGNASSQILRKSGQERWFTKLPPVLFLELSRFQFNTDRGVAEKVNNFLDFPDVLYMDRYLEVNKNITRSKREEVKSLKEERARLNTQLESYLLFAGCDSSPRIPLVSVLNRTMQFARASNVGSGDGHAEADEGAARDTDISSPGSGNNLMQVDSPCPSPASLTPASSMSNLNASPKQEKSQNLPSDGFIQIPIKVENFDKDLPTPMDVELSDAPRDAVEAQCPVPPVSGPTPRYVSDLELKVISGCISRWRQEIEEDVAALNKSLAEVDRRIQEMYDTPTLTTCGYKLHAVMVHEGDANQGHYWAYVYHPQRQVWLKFNDNAVSETDWDSMKKESAGGRLSTSAYSMIYLDMSRPDLLLTLDAQALVTTATREALTDDLEEYLKEDNKRFAAEILSWDDQLTRKQEQPQPANKDASAGVDVLIGDDPECQIIESKSDLSNSHAALASESTIKVIHDEISSPHEKKKAHYYNLIFSKIYNNAKTKPKEEDSKLDSFLQYLIAVDVDIDIIKRALHEQICLPTLDNRSEVVRHLVAEAKENLSKAPYAIETAKWHKAYHNFRIACYYFVLGVDRYSEKKVEDSVQLLTMSYIINQKLIDQPLECGGTQENKGMNKSGLIKYFHLSVESLNSHLVEEFEAGNNPAHVASRVSNVLVPAVQILQERTNNYSSVLNRDADVLETVRGRWCALLETQMATDKYEYWTRIFNTVVPDDNAVSIKQPLVPRYPKMAEDLKLASRFRSIMQTVLKEES